MSNMTCPSCGGQKATKINDHEYRCEYCGHTFSPITPSQPIFKSQNFFQQTPALKNASFNTTNSNGKNRMTTAILAILLGGIGAHQFYLGNTGKGILYLVFIWTYIPAIIGVIEGIMLITQTDEEFNAKPKLIIT